MSQLEQVKGLLKDLQQDVAFYQQLAQLLQQQREAMLACHAERSEQAGANLSAIYPRLQASARRRAQTLQALRLATNGEGLKALFSRLPAALKVQAESWWQTLEEQAVACQQLNERNGLLLNHQREMLGALFRDRPEDFLYSR